MKGFDMEEKNKDCVNSSKQTSNVNNTIQKERELLIDAKQKGPLSTISAFMKLSGPGWLQSGITLGGGSLSSSLYLGVLVGFSFIWLQPLAMILGIIMLGAIAYVTLSTGERPFRSINSHVNPVLGWGWLLASMIANLVWSLPQFTLGTAAIRQNLLPGLVGGGADSAIQDPIAQILVVGLFLGVCIAVTTFYSIGGSGVKIFEIIIRTIVSIIVLCFFGVVVKLSISGEIEWGRILRGLIPDMGLLFRPTDSFLPYIGEVTEKFQPFWTNLIVSQQRDVMISAAATAVGINMTFLLPYSMLRKGWDKHFRGLAIFDLSTGLFIPFVLATGFVVIASASQFHAKPAPGFLGETDTKGNPVAPAKNLVGPYNSLLEQRLKYEIGPDEFSSLTPKQVKVRTEVLSEADKKMAAMLVKRDAFNLADTLAPLTGGKLAQYIFGLGVVCMALSAATMLMTINGLCFCELLNRRPGGWTQRLGVVMVSVGALGPFFWKKAAFWLAVPTSIFAMVLLPIAYFTFYLMMNQKSLLRDNIPTGVRRIVWNIMMAIAAGIAAFGSIWSLWSKAGWYGIAAALAFIVLAIGVQIARNPSKAEC